jgi:hypothetical protein
MPAQRLPPINLEALGKALGEWRGLLQQAPAVARQLLRKLLPEPLTLTRTAEGLIHYRGRIATSALLAGVAGVMALVPPGCHARTFRRDSVSGGVAPGCVSRRRTHLRIFV